MHSCKLLRLPFQKCDLGIKRKWRELLCQVLCQAQLCIYIQYQHHELKNHWSWSKVQAYFKTRILTVRKFGRSLTQNLTLILENNSDQIFLSHYSLLTTSFYIKLNNWHFLSHRIWDFFHWNNLQRHVFFPSGSLSWGAECKNSNNHHM